MQFTSVVKKFGAIPILCSIPDSAEKLESFPKIRTFFTNYRNPIGIEVEVENIKDSNHKWKLWNSSQDSSLKIDGMEFVSLPISGQQVDYALYELELHFSKQKKSLIWSHRTSIHIHQNMSTLSCEQLLAYIMAYGLFEDLFFSLCAPLREGNPYCYRATEIDTDRFMKVHTGSKYCALNLAPLQTFCTIEWRHMHGNQDFRLIRRWIQLIMKMHHWANNLSTPHAREYMRATIQKETFTGLAKSIFGASVALFTEDQIIRGCRRNAFWSIQVSTKEFESGS